MTPRSDVRDPAQEMVAVLASVESHLTEAAGLADRLAASLRRREAELAEIRILSPNGIHAGEPPRSLHTTFDQAALTRDGLQHSADIGDELLVLLDLTRTTLHLARDSILESACLVAAAGSGAPEVEVLPHWVGHLDRIIQSARDGTRRAITHLRNAKQSFDQLEVKLDVAADERRQDARQLQAAVDEGDSDITRAKITVGLARAFLEDGRVAARQGREAARRVSVEDVLPAGMRHVRTHPTSVAGAAPALKARHRPPVSCSQANCGIPRS